VISRKKKKKKKMKRIKKVDKKRAEEMRKIILLRKKILGLILRVNTFGSLEHMKIEIFKWPKSKYKFLNLFFEMLDDIKIMEALPAIIDFTQTIKDHLNHKITRGKAKEVKIEVYLR
jgi:hypothetical protein